MDIAIYQILTPALSVVMIGRVISLYRREKRTIREVVVQLFFWFMISFVAILPDFFVGKVEFLTGLKSGVTGILFLSNIILGILVLYLLHENQKRTEDITKIVRELALKEKK